MSRILIIEDEPAILRGLTDNLELESYEVVGVDTAEKGHEAILESEPDLVILDVMLPGMSGHELCRRLRREGFRMPILMLTARGDEVDRVMGLDLGADDYLTKPFSVLELLARIRALLRRSAAVPGRPDAVEFGDVRIDFKKYEATKRGRPVSLSPKEFGLLQTLASRPGEVITRDELLDDVWGADHFPSSRTVDNHVAMLRSKLEDEQSEPRHIVTVHGVGYKLVR